MFCCSVPFLLKFCCSLPFLLSLCYPLFSSLFFGSVINWPHPCHSVVHCLLSCHSILRCPLSWCYIVYCPLSCRSVLSWHQSCTIARLLSGLVVPYCSLSIFCHSINHCPLSCHSLSFLQAFYNSPFSIFASLLSTVPSPFVIFCSILCSPSCLLIFYYLLFYQ